MSGDLSGVLAIRLKITDIIASEGGLCQPPWGGGEEVALKSDDLGVTK